MYSIDGHAELRVGEWRVTSDLESQSRGPETTPRLCPAKTDVVPQFRYCGTEESISV